MNQPLWGRFKAVPGELVTEIAHLFFKRKTCKPMLCRIVYLSMVAVYFTFPVLILFVFIVIVRTWRHFFFESLSLTAEGALAFGVVAAVAISWPIYLWIKHYCSVKPYDFYFGDYNHFQHPLGEPEYLAEGSCVQIHRCKSCNYVVVLPEHHSLNENWKYESEDSCRQYRTCTRCGSVDYRENQHQYEDWAYTSDDKCDQARKCGRCKYVDRRVVHEYSNWKYIADADCDQERICLRDRNKENRVEHIIDSWNYDVTSSVKEGTCDRCKKRISEPCSAAEMEPEPDEYYAWKYIDW